MTAQSRGGDVPARRSRTTISTNSIRRTDQAPQPPASCGRSHFRPGSSQTPRSDSATAVSSRRADPIHSDSLAAAQTAVRRRQLDRSDSARRAFEASGIIAPCIRLRCRGHPGSRSRFKGCSLRMPVTPLRRNHPVEPRLFRSGQRGRGAVTEWSTTSRQRLILIGGRHHRNGARRHLKGILRKEGR